MKGSVTTFPLLLGALGLVGCEGAQLSQPWELDRLRILGVQATPAEPQPGQTVSFDSLFHVPEGETFGGAIWTACLPESADEFGCAPDPELDSILEEFAALEDLEKDDFTKETYFEIVDILQRAQAAGLVGYQDAEGNSVFEDFGIELEWTPPEDALDGLSESEALEGLSALVTVVAFLEGEDTEDDEVNESTEIAYKRMPVSLATTPNTNPEIVGFKVEGQEIDLEIPVEVPAGETIEIELLFSGESIETYTYVNSSGESEERTEEPYISWYSAYGTLSDDPYSLYPYTTGSWTAGTVSGKTEGETEGLEEGTEDEIIAVVRDRRGGMAWASVKVLVTQ